MIYVKLNDGRTQNLIHIGLINLDGKNVVYQSAKGSLNEYKETFDTKDEANARYEELKGLLID